MFSVGTDVVVAVFSADCQKYKHVRQHHDLKLIILSWNLLQLFCKNTFARILFFLTRFLTETLEKSETTQLREEVRDNS